MRAIRQYEFGPAENLRYEELADPQPAAGQVGIAVEASGVHLVDTAIRRGEGGRLFPLPELPMVPGREVAGIVDEVAPGGRRCSSHDQRRSQAMSQQLVQMETPIEGLHASAPEPLPFAPEFDIRAFVLRRSRGNVLVYSVTGFDPAAPKIRGLGGISRQYLNHRHEAMFAAERVTAPLFVHEAERVSVAARHAVRGTFSRRHVLDEDLEVIPTPGHTPGATAYLWDSGRHRFLFTGDTIYLEGGDWVAAVLESSDRAAYIESLGLIRELDFDVLVPWAATSGQPYLAVTSRADARRRIDAIVERVRRGEDG